MKHHQITASMAKDIAFKLGAELNNEEAEIFADGYNAAMLKVNKNASTELPNDANLSTNSPVMPDGWVMVPKEPTKLMRMAIHPLTETACMNCGCKVVAECEDNIFMAWDDMLSAAPQPEVTNGE